MINLLPPEIRNQRAVRSHIYSVTVVYVAIVAILVLGSLALETYNLTLKSSLGENESTLNGLKQERKLRAELVSKIAFIEDRVASGAKYQDKADWSSLLDELALTTPDLIRLTSITLGTESSKNQLTVSGETADPRSIILFRDRLDQSKIFTSSQITSITSSGTGTAKKSVFSLVTVIEAVK